MGRERERNGKNTVALHSVCIANYSGCRDAVVCAPLCRYARPVWPLMFAIPAECANTTIATFRFNAATAHPLECYYLAPRYLPEDFSAAYLQRQQSLVRSKYPKFVLCFSKFKRSFLIQFHRYKTSSATHISDYNRSEILLILYFNLQNHS